MLGLTVIKRFFLMINNILKELYDIQTRDEKIKSILLTGGRSAARFYKEWIKSSSFDFYRNAFFYFGDERCVAKNDMSSNYFMVNSIFDKRVSQQHIYEINGDAVNPNIEADRYSAILPIKFDLVFLSVGEDGHVASIFPNSTSFNSLSNVTFISDSPKPPRNRITVAPNVIYNAERVIVMIEGKIKAKIAVKALHNPSDKVSLPLRLTIGRSWFLDKEASELIRERNISNFFKTRVVYA